MPSPRTDLRPALGCLPVGCMPLYWPGRLPHRPWRGITCLCSSISLSQPNRVLGLTCALLGDPWPGPGQLRGHNLQIPARTCGPLQHGSHSPELPHRSCPDTPPPIRAAAGQLTPPAATMAATPTLTPGTFQPQPHWASLMQSSADLKAWARAGSSPHLPCCV